MLGMTLPPCCPYQPRRSVSPHQSLATIHAAFARKVRARPSGCSTLEAIWVHLRYGPVARLPSLRDGFVNRLQDYQFPSFLLFKLRGSGLLPRWDSHPLFMPAFAGRTHIRTDLPERAFGKVFRRLPYPVPGADWGRGSHRGRLKERRARESPCRFGEIHAFGEGGPAGARAHGPADRKAGPKDGIGVPLIDCLLPPIHGLFRFPAV